MYAITVGAPPAMAALTALLAVAVARVALCRNRTLDRIRLRAIAITLLMAIGIFWLAPPTLRVLDDETDLLGTARSMFEHFRAEQITQGLWNVDGWQTFEAIQDKRPHFFPFLVSLLHHVRGVDYRDAFVVNFLALWAGLFVVQRWLAEHKSEGLGWAGTLLVLTPPIVGLNATSGGFDHLALMLQLALCATAHRFAQSKRPEHFQLLWFLALAFANTRYEGSLFLLFLAAALWPSREAVFAAFRGNTALYVSTVALMAPILATVVAHGEELEAPPGQPTFALAYLLPHLWTTLGDMFDVQHATPFAGVWNALSVLALPWAVRSWWRAERNTRWFSACVMLGLLAQFFFYLTFHAGFSTRPTVVRYFAPVSAALALVPAWWMGQSGKARLPFFALAATAFLGHLPRLNQAIRLGDMPIPQETRLIYDYLDRHPTRHAVIVTDRSPFFTARGMGAMTYAHLSDAPFTVLDALTRGSADVVYALQEIQPQTGVALHRQTLPPFYHTKTVAEWPVQPTYTLRLSVVSALP